MTNPWVCTECGGRQAERGPCVRCSAADTLDVRDERTRELMYDIDLRIAQKAETHARMIGVFVGVAVVIALWMLPGYRTLRSTAFALPLFFDQFMLMAGIGVAVSKLLEKKLGAKRFPYLDTYLQVIN